VNPADLRRFHSGDRSLFRSLVEGESPRLLRYAAWLCGDAQDAQDLVQETWIAAYEQRTTFKGRAPLLSWLTAICKSHYLATHRTTARREQLLAAHSSYLAESGSYSSATGIDPLARRRLAEALGQLPERQRDVIILRLVEGLSTRETADRLGAAEGTIKSSLARGLSALRPLLEDCES
jgi:RNA polymerase sigma-70 factor, ECF subfamily